MSSHGLHGEDGAVRVIADVHRGSPSRSTYCSHASLPERFQLGKGSGSGQTKWPRPVRDGDGVYVAHAAAGRQGLERRGNMVRTSILWCLPGEVVGEVG